MASHPHPLTGFPEDFVAQVLDEALTHRVRVQGVAGLQGSGKSTLAAQVVRLAKQRGLRAVALSLDDFYLGRRERLALGRRIHPLLATRGPPGSHDLSLACGTLDALRQGRATALPRFDKLADRRLPPSRWTKAIKPVDLVLFEGWLLKVPPEAPAALHAPLNALEREADPTGYWRGWCNGALRAYAPLWERIDRLLFLHGPGFAVVPEWRWQQECAAQATPAQRRGMDRHAVERFVMFFERLSRQALRTLPAIAERSVRIDAQRKILHASTG
ncbi:MAG: kinase [Proteobacteria bacterium]|nr:kinase [Pseudomonadota bacterium]